MTSDLIDCAKCGQPHPRCTGHNKQQEPCMRWPKRGAKVCPRHGGHAPQVKAKAAERRAEEDIQRALDRYTPQAAPVTDPLTSLLTVAGEITTFKDFVAGRISEMNADAWRYEGEHAEQLRAEIALYERALDRTVRALVDINRLDLEARLVKVREAQATAIFAAVERALADLDLTPDQRARVPEAMRTHLANLTQGTTP